ncbi:phosphotransferase enzyme family protein [Pseudomonas frederiksbergensis]|uniref:Aminoglycoside phosphotransferase n=1 Tax=Pseudomonas frederiksbergensis TaxID=104087 RepID=A0A423KFM2_9PSED|nr:phosphotransferase [Pseudomonas frederiksbergensis]RON51591.1 aminoglycoside phosphotransferase [Pseudomonas frederiksbergensis]
MAALNALKSHGLSLDPVAADWPALQTRDVEQLLLGYPQLGAPLSLDWHSPRPFSAASLVQTDAATLFIKRHHQRVRTPAWLSEEHRFMAHLRQRGMPVSQVLADRNGATAVALGEWTYEVHALAEGQDLYRDALSWTPFFSQQQAWSAGASLARLHLAAEDYQAAPRQTPVLVANFKFCSGQDLGASLQTAIERDPALTDYFNQHDWREEWLPLLLPWQRQLQPLLARQPDLWTHNDWHGSNLLWDSTADDAQVSCVLDFGLADRTFALFDLATAIERNGIPWLELDSGGSAPPALDDIDALLEGYASVKPLSSADLLTLAALLPLVHVDFALSEIAYFQGVVGSVASADVAYHAYLLGHTRWFSTVQGERLIDHLKRSAGS